MQPALVLVDVQNDFLDRPNLAPGRESFIEAAADLLARARASRIPVVHVQTVVAADGGDRMPHWKRKGIDACIRGSIGAQPPSALRPLAGEAVVEKRFFSAFGVPAMEETLRAAGVDTLIVAGLYLHGCVRATVFDAYERGYEVFVAEDAVASTDPANAELSRDYMDDRAATFLPSDAILAKLSPAQADVRAAARAVYRHRDPARLDDVLEEVSIDDGDDVDRVVAAARRGRHALTELPFARRAEILERWAQGIEARRESLATCVAREIGKPITDVSEEIDRALAHVRTALTLFAAGPVERLAGDVAVRHRPHGVVGIVTPFNNPLAIPAGKIAPALLFGNAVVLKPALEAPASTRMLVEALFDAGFPEGALGVAHGGARTARLVVRHPGIDAVSITGSNATGRGVHALCARDGKPLQAELGGNNAAIVLGDCDVEAEARALARAAYGFAGQRCTAIRRFIVERSVYASFVEALARAGASLRIGEPLDRETVVGPMIDARRRDRVLAVIAAAEADGASMVTGGIVPGGLEHGAWLSPVLLTGVIPTARVFREETFGPVAVVVPARDLDEAIALANAVPHGLVASLSSDDPDARRRFADAVEAGIVRVDRRAPFLHAEAPFGGWKASGVGPPEHGVWDRLFYARPQALYGNVGGNFGGNFGGNLGGSFGAE